LPLPALWPEARADHALAYSAARGRVVLFGGVGATADTWEWDGVTGLWQVFPAITAPTSSSAAVWPAARVNHGLTYDPARGAVVLFSGRGVGFGAVYRDVWEWGRP